MKDLSIVIVSYKGWNRLVKCLESLETLSFSRFSGEIIVVDNHSDEPAIYELEKRFSGYTFIHNPVNGGYGNGVNLGVSASAGRYILVLNPDTVATEAEIEKLLNVAINNPGFGLVSCRQVSEKGKESVVTGDFPHFFNLTGFQRAVFSGRREEPDPGRNILYPDWVSGSVMLMKRTVFNQCSGFDEDFWMYFEDVDICRRIRDLGLVVACCRHITIEHNHGGSSRINIKTAALTKTEVHISRHLYISKHMKGPERIVTESFLVINNLVTGGLTAVAGLIFFFIPKLFLRSTMFASLVRYYLGALKNLTWLSPRSVHSR